jgi:metal-sulfur cluster biosynthetic enzyme
MWNSHNFFDIDNKCDNLYVVRNLRRGKPAIDPDRIIAPYRFALPIKLNRRTLSQAGGTWAMRDEVPCDFPAGYDGAAILKRLAQVLDPELDESILDLGFVRGLRLRSGHAEVALRLPTSWCAVNFAYLMAEDARNALLSVEGIGRVTVSLGDHCAAPEIEAAVNDGRRFAEAFPGEAAGSLEALRLTFLRKGFFSRQEQLLRALRDAGCSTEAICVLRLGEVWVEDDAIVIRRPGFAPVECRSAAVLRRYSQRRAELALDCSPTAPLIVDLEGKPLSKDHLQAHYETIRTVRVALEANGLFCRALLSVQHRDAAGAAGHPIRSLAGNEGRNATGDRHSRGKQESRATGLERTAPGPLLPQG